jgi:GT2 family glycosyltransferase
MLEVTIIIVNWNGKHMLADCLDAVIAQDCPDFEVVLVDNGSTDGSAQFVQSNYPSVKLVQLQENRGFTGGNLAGFNCAAGDFVALLNNDTRPDKGWLRALSAGMHADSRIGICASKIIIDGTNKIDSVGDLFTTAFTGTKLGSLRDCEEFNTSIFVHGACAAAALYRRTMLDQIGFLDDDFYFNHEDTDLNLRAWLAGWKCLFVPEAIVHHKVSASVGELSDKTVYYFSRNNVWVWVKNIPLGILLCHLPQRLTYEFSAFVFFCILKKKWKPFLRGKIDAFKHLPQMLEKRKEVQKHITLSNHEIHHNLMPIIEYLKIRMKYMP